MSYSEYTKEAQIGKVVLTYPAQRIAYFIGQRLEKDTGGVLDKARWFQSYWNKEVASRGVLPRIEIGSQPTLPPDSLTIITRRLVAPVIRAEDEQRRSFIVSCMRLQNGHRVWAPLLCVLLFWLTANPPHCDLCDGISFTTPSTSQSTVKHTHTVPPDTCNGICTCCGFYGLPSAETSLVPANHLVAGVLLEPTRPGQAPSSTVFRPPRIVAS
jgi:hypothetical protein